VYCNTICGHLLSLAALVLCLQAACSGVDGRPQQTAIQSSVTDFPLPTNFSAAAPASAPTALDFGAPSPAVAAAAAAPAPSPISNITGAANAPQESIQMPENGSYAACSPAVVFVTWLCSVTVLAVL
jgi:hypothetical protein